MSLRFSQHMPPFSEDISVLVRLISTTTCNTLMWMQKLESVGSTTDIVSSVLRHTPAMFSPRSPTSPHMRVNIFSSASQMASSPMVSMSPNSRRCTNSRIYISTQRRRSPTSFEATFTDIMIFNPKTPFTSLLRVDTSTEIKAWICSSSHWHD